mmetsp:Transcript_28755/g.21431  ORF Transcript_28755/g.21431 Transcript_28755/m.21431 type:complete len:81 (+) Transcript_28755:82-324(+)
MTPSNQHEKQHMARDHKDYYIRSSQQIEEQQSLESIITSINTLLIEEMQEDIYTLQEDLRAIKEDNLVKINEHIGEFALF